MPKLAVPTVLVALALAATAASAQPPQYPKLIPAPGGEVVIPSAGGQRAYDEIKYAPARRAGDVLYISGVIAGPRGDEGRDAEAFKAQARRAFTAISLILKAEGLTFAEVTMINTFHVWNGPGFTGTRDEQFAAFSAVKDEFMPPPHPAWTAVGTTGLLIDNGVVEIQMIAYAPRAKR
jgi:enamine deaminase RidA (YjgF/YER057c/UK114 family)